MIDAVDEQNILKDTIEFKNSQSLNEFLYKYYRHIFYTYLLENKIDDDYRDYKRARKNLCPVNGWIYNYLDFYSQKKDTLIKQKK